MERLAAADRERRWRDARQSAAELREVREGLRTALAEPRGWIVAETYFTLRQLRDGHAGRYCRADYAGNHYLGADVDSSFIDHEEFFRERTRPYRPAAILTHTYRSEADLRAYISTLGLGIEVLPWSWYYPRSTVAALITRAAHRSDHIRPNAMADA